MSWLAPWRNVVVTPHTELVSRRDILPDVHSLILAFAQRRDARKCADGRFACRNCGHMTGRFVRFAHWRGVDAAAWRVIGFQDQPGMHPFWLKYPWDSRNHYVAEVGGVIVDWTRRQFDPASPHHAVFSSLDEAAPDRIARLDREYPLCAFRNERLRRHRRRVTKRQKRSSDWRAVFANEGY